MNHPRPTAWLPRDEYLSTLPKATCYACLYFTDERGRPLQLKSCYESTEIWQNAGGNLDPGETPWQTAVRETREETGLVITGGPRPLLLTHFIPEEPSWPVSRVGFIFDGGILTDDQLDHIVLDPEEHSDWSVRTLDEWRQEMNAATYDRLTTADTARRTGTGAYLHTML